MSRQPQLSTVHRHPHCHVALLALALGTTGCALRVGGDEHYIGPVWFRYGEPPSGRAYVSQVRAVGIVGELGTPSGVTLGGIDRVAVVPTSGSPAAGEPPRWKWTRFGMPGDLEPGEWYLSLFYMRGDDVPPPCFIRRVSYGASALAGGELAALSIGVTSRTHTQPPHDAVTALDFTASRPLDTRFVVWPATAGGELPFATILEEVSP